MSSRATGWLMGLVVLGIGSGTVRADLKTKAAQEAAEAVMARFGSRAARSGLPMLAKEIESFAARYGEEALIAVRRVGPKAFAVVEEAGINGPRAVRLLALYGEEGATCVLRRPKAMQQFLRFGEEAAEALVRHPGVAEGLIEKGGAQAARALGKVSAKGARRMAMVLEGELKAAAGKPELMEVIAKYGQKACDFIWENKAVLAGSAILAAFIADPEPYLSGVKDIAQAVGEPVLKPVAEGFSFTLRVVVCLLVLLIVSGGMLIYKYGLPRPEGFLARLLLARVGK